MTSDKNTRENSDFSVLDDDVKTKPKIEKRVISTQTYENNLNNAEVQQELKRINDLLDTLVQQKPIPFSTIEKTEINEFFLKIK